jgi:hypothetical protein
VSGAGVASTVLANTGAATTLITGGTVVTATGPVQADVLVSGE